MKHRARFSEATTEDIQEMLDLLEEHPKLYMHVDFLLNWTEDKDQVGGHDSVLRWMRYFVHVNDPY